MNRLRRSLFALLVTVVVSLAAGWFLASAVRPTSAGPIAPIEMPSGGMVVDAPSEQPRGGAEPVGPMPPTAGSVTAPAGHRADDDGDEDGTDGNDIGDDDDG